MSCTESPPPLKSARQHGVVRLPGGLQAVPPRINVALIVAVPMQLDCVVITHVAPLQHTPVGDGHGLAPHDAVGSAMNTVPDTEPHVSRSVDEHAPDAQHTPLHAVDVHVVSSPR